ncbi:MAG: hypothetical protein WAN83_05205 [Candidatus Dormiibacterota bacterium]
MDSETAAPVEAEIAGEGSYLRRARALVTSRSELFLRGPARSAWLNVAGPPEDRERSPLRQAARQLTLPLPRERTRRRARMVR